MDEAFGEPLEKLRAIPIHDNGEPLVDVCALSNRVHFAKEHPVFKDIPRTGLLRENVAQRLAQAAAKLPDDIEVMVLEGFRTMDEQWKQYNHLLSDIAAKHPDWDADKIKKVTNNLSAPPDDPCPPPHTTGGAVDLYLVYANNGKMLDMTSPYKWDAESAPTAIEGLSQTARTNRKLLIDTLEATGLTNYAGEWWHWSYGDSGWALRIGAAAAIYDRISNPNRDPAA